MSTISYQGRGLPNYGSRLATLFAIAGTLLVLAIYAAPAAIMLAACLGILLASFLLFDPLLYLAVFLIPIAPILQVEGFVVHDVVSLARLLMFAGVFARKLVDREPVLDWLWRGKVEKWLLAFFAVGVFSAAVINPLEPNSTRSLFRLASFLLFYYAITGWTKSESQLRKICMALFISTIGVCILGLVQVATDGFGDWFHALHAAESDMIPPWQGRIASVFLGVNSLAAHLNLVLPLAVAVDQSSSMDYYLRFAAKLCFILGVINLVLTQSRGGFLAFGFVVLVLVRTVLRKSGSRRDFYLTLVLSAVVGLALVFLTLRSTEIGANVASERFSSADETTMERLIMYGAALTMFASAPIFGIGYGNFRAHFNSFIGDLPNDIWDTHNLYLKFLAEIGLVGFLVFCGLVFTLMRMARRSWREGTYPFERICAVGLIGGLVSVLVQGLVEALIENPQFGSMLWFLFAVFVVSRRLGRNEIPTTRISAV